jgi:hypothetical protein
MTTRGTKITGLNDLETVTGNIIIPVVDPTVTLATPDGQTLQSNVYQIGNYILQQAGNLFPAANVANTVRNNAQPNITSVGTLTSLNSTGTINLANTSNVSLGNVSNLHILGGYPGYILSTNGSGNLTWVVDGSVSGDGGNAYTSILLQASLNGGNAYSV